ncbi:mitochondrial 54S ribosomal protein uL15m [Limtongia smithiae]|uniref:mitochondrial 54S ribosomal protein uL15m n=1 Tax=Limtongia smithiae TaxID=1125753 RepID=UPI0034CF3FAE
MALGMCSAFSTLRTARTCSLAAFAFCGRVSVLCTRSASIMSTLYNVPSSYKKKKRVGRGPSSGKGKTSGRGMNGQKQKESVAPWFEGGQTPMSKLLPKLGFSNYGRKDYVKVNLSKIQQWIDMGRLDPTQPITMKHLLDSRLCHGIKDGVKLLADGKETLTTPVNIIVSAASREAVRRVSELGGKVTSKYYNRLNLRALLHPEFFTYIPLDASPVRQREMKYYRDPTVGGYLVGVPRSGIKAKQAESSA